MTGELLTVPADAYHRDEVADVPTLSSSVAKIVIGQSPAHARHAHPRLNEKYARDESDKYDAGIVCHAILLEGTAPLDVVEICHYRDWKTDASQAAKKAAREAGRIPLLEKHYEGLVEMVHAVRAQLDELDVTPRPLAEGKPEQTFVWEDRGVKCRARLDWLRDDMATVDDIKTTGWVGGANPRAFGRQIFKLGYDLQAAFYLRGLRAVTGETPAWRWVVAETMPPYAVTVVQPDDDVLAIGDAKVDRALEVWAECLATDCWPAYSSTVETASAPAWETAWLLTPELEETVWAQM